MFRQCSDQPSPRGSLRPRHQEGDIQCVPLQRTRVVGDRSVIPPIRTNDSVKHLSILVPTSHPTEVRHFRCRECRRFGLNRWIPVADVDWPGCTSFSTSISNCNCATVVTVSIKSACCGHNSHIPALSPSTAGACHTYPPGMAGSSVCTCVANPSRGRRNRDNYCLQFNGFIQTNRGTASPTQPQSAGGNYSPTSPLKPRILTHINYSSTASHYIYSQVLASIIHPRTLLITFHIIHIPFPYYKYVRSCQERRLD